MIKSLISIIIPVFNRAHLIQETLNSVLSQTYQNWECIIIDDGSTDNSKEVVSFYLNQDNRFKFYKRHNTKKKGPSACRNIGIEKAKGDYVIFLDSDDVLCNTCLENRIKKIERNPELDFVVFSMGHFKTLGNLYVDNGRKVFHGSANDTIKHFLAHKYPWNTTRPIYKKEFIVSIDGFNENLIVFTDPELALRMLLTKKVKYLTVDITDCFYRVDELHENKYLDIEFRKKMQSNYLVFKTNIFNLLTKKEILFFSNELKYAYAKSIKVFNFIEDSNKGKKIKELFYENLLFSFKEKIYLNLLKFSMRYRNFKGMYRLSNFLMLSFKSKVISSIK